MMVVDEAVLGDPVRLAAVHQALRTMSGGFARLDDVATLAARLIETPVAVITLVDNDDVHFLGSHGLPDQISHLKKLPLAYSVCKFVVCADHLIMAQDMLDDPDERLAEHPVANEFGMRAFLSVPIRDHLDRPIGSLTVFDRRPRAWSDPQCDTLMTIAATMLAPDSVTRPGPSGVPAAGDLNDMPDLPVDTEFLRGMVRNLDAGVMACDAEGRVVYISRVMREMRGMSGQGTATIEPTMLTAPDNRPLAWEQTPMMRALASGDVITDDVYVRRAGQRMQVFHTIARPIAAADGTIRGAVAVAHDVTALRRVERFRNCHLAVEHILQKAATPAEAAPEALRALTVTLGWPAAELYLIDDATGLLLPVGHWDASGLEADGFFGHVPIRGQGITGRVWESGRAIWEPDISLSTELRTSHERERVEICLSRGVRTALAVPVRDGNSLLGVLTCYAGTQEFEPDLLTVLLDGVAAQFGVFVAQCRAEELSRQLARAQSDFVDLVGHELRTPLTAITANATLLEEEAATLDPDVRQMTQVIARNAGNLQRIANTLLDLAGLDSGHLVLDVQEVDLAALVTSVITAACRDGERLTLVSELPRSLIIAADGTRLRQVIDDILSNAVRYSPPGAPVHITLRADGSMADLCIADVGIGTPAAERARVFDRFFRGSNVRHQGTSGSGLGLSLARAIVLLHGGTIRLDENRPSGTIVCVRLPLSGPPPATPII
ncbi:ATP-binding protein [Actinoplanes rectilineatus]|uniref:sensor histidine kinase n=1 Tax=Actinoplanes rectilineatus TaxID=113571 RepID=UPI0005F2E6B3|nr:ATP-binding protein [Actinoplanes rectilineatus]